jgi:D-tyrosyl-tRNA(Tyr) deacylase
MRAVLQRVSSASVEVEGRTVGSCGKGYLVLLGVAPNDTEAEAERLWGKICNLRVFDDPDGKMNLSLADVDGGLLLVSQFTLYANCKKGNRPSFIEAGSPEHAEALYEYIIERCRERVPVVEKGSFGAEMAVDLLNDGPFTIILDSNTL